ncbi:hypothetical protein G6N76_09660 [Rhizobium daejeonense]|uniref:Uncharacterized protein n=1 Tax=Rhizobium daejeonense TaxID=240521 RepID=A0A6M1S118_9HYPH|nr:hypothetical protein [Rhizobium daejeonense]NGO63941.1 hypothetical protein [Rhizobium daejeonense]
MARHGSLAEQLDALLTFATAPDHEPEPIQTNWTITPANENNPEDVAELKTERLWNISPSVEEMMRQVHAGPVHRNDVGQIVRIGRLRFSDGTQTEQAMKVTIDGKVVTFQDRMPTGAMLGTVDKERAQRGGNENPQELTDSNDYFAEMLKTRKGRYVTASRKRQPRQQISREEAKRILAEAYAKAGDVSKLITRYPDGLPCGSQKVADSFIGMRKTTCAGGGSMAWQDIVTAKADQKEWFDALDALKATDREVLEAARTATNYADIGMSIGQSSEYARRKGGKRVLKAANDNLMAIIGKISA